MINVILTYNQTESFPEQTQSIINNIQFSVIPEMIIVDHIVDEILVSKTIPYQANIEEEKYEELLELLQEYGEVNVIGKWNNDGSKIELDIEKYRAALKNIEEFETAVFINGEDYTGRENEFVPELDENDLEITPTRVSFTRLKSSTPPTTQQAKTIQVNVFNSAFVRQL